MSRAGMDAEFVLEEANCGDDGSLHIDIWYPRNKGTQVKRVQIGLIDVRAADDIRVSYDFGRDGWVVEQASIFEWQENDTVCDPGWKEVAFVPAWSQRESGE